MNNFTFNTKDKYYVLFCLVITSVVFANALGNGFVNWDDPANFLNHPVISNELGLWSSLQEIFSSTVLGNYNPLSTASYLIDKALFGFENEWGWHLMNILLHLGNVALVYTLSRKLGLGNIGALFVAIVFGIHPMRVESVTWVTERKDVLFGLFYLLSIHQYLYFKSSKKSKHIALLITFFTLALLSKIQAVSLPLSLLAIDYLLMGKWAVRDWYSKWYLFGMSLIVGLLGIYFLGESKSLAVDYADVSIVENFILAGYSLLVYLYKAIIPFPLSAYYQHPESLSIIHYTGIIGLIGFVFVLIKSYRNDWKWLFFSLFFFIVNIVFVLQWVKAGQGYLADRFTYIPYLGLFLGVGYWIDQKLSNGISNIQKSGFALLILLFGGLSIYQNSVWENGETLWSQSIKTNPESARSYAARGGYYNRRGLKSKALEDFNKAASLNDSPLYKMNRAKLLLGTSRDIEDLKLALNDFISIQDKNSEVYINIAAIYTMLGDNLKAISTYNEGESAFPDNFNFALNRGRVLQALGKYVDAEADFEKAIRLNPNSYEPYFEKGRLLRNLQRFDESIPLLNSAIKLNPNFCQTFYERSMLYAQTGQVEAARDDLKIAIGLKCENIDENYKKQLGF